MCSNHTRMNTHIWSSCCFYLIKAIIKIQWQEHNGNPISWQSLADCSWPGSHYLESQYTHSNISMQTHLWLVSHWFETQFKWSCPVSMDRIHFPGAGKRAQRKEGCICSHLCIPVTPMHFSSRAPRQCESTPPSKVVHFTYADRQNSRGPIAPVTWTVCKCAAARTHSTPTQLKLHLRWKVTGPVHCLGNGRRCWWREQHCSVMMLSEKRVSSGQTPARLLSIH